jgi:hypothetical protein
MRPKTIERLRRRRTSNPSRRAVPAEEAPKERPEPLFVGIPERAPRLGAGLWAVRCLNNDLLNLTLEQLTVYRKLQRIRMGWVTLIVALSLFSIGFLSFLYAVFFVQQQTASKVIMGGIDTLLGWALKTIITNLFPPPKERK